MFISRRVIKDYYCIPMDSPCSTRTSGTLTNPPLGFGIWVIFVPANSRGAWASPMPSIHSMLLVVGDAPVLFSSRFWVRFFVGFKTFMAQVEFHTPAVLLLNHPICFNSDKHEAGWSYETYPKIIDLRKLPGFAHATNIFTTFGKGFNHLENCLEQGDMLDPLSSTF